MAQFVCDPELTSGQLAQAARRDRVGDVYKWEPGGAAGRPAARPPGGAPLRVCGSASGGDGSDVRSAGEPFD